MAKPSKPRFFKPAAKQDKALPWSKTGLTIERISREGRGIARHNGKIVFVDGALPQENVLARCTATQRSFDEAHVLSVVDASPQRVAPFCPVAERCGGCQLQHWDLSAQRQHKEQELFADLKKIQPQIRCQPALLTAEQGFRHRLKLAVQPTNDFSLAMRQESSHQLVTITQCPIVSAAVNHWVKKLPALLNSCGGLSQLTDIVIDEDTQANVGLLLRFAKAPIESVIERLSKILREAGATALVMLSSVDKKSWQILYQQGHLQLRLDVAEQALGLVYRPGDFTQTNWALNQQMIATALEWLSPQQHETALDLFAGIGNFSLPLAQQVKQLHGFEFSAAMVTAASANAEANHLTNVKFAAQDLFVDDLRLPDADIAIIDPPRAGAESVCKALANKSILQRLVYISCNPATLVRDAAILQAGGLKPVKAAFVDMFTYTGHSEAIVFFVR